MGSKYFYIVLLISVLAVMGSRLIPMFFLHRITIPNWLNVWLGFLPVGVIAAMLASDFSKVILHQPLWETEDFFLKNFFDFFLTLTPGSPLHYIFASLGVLLVTHLTHSFAVGFLSGMLFYQLFFWM